MLLKIKNSVFQTNSPTYEKNVKEQNCYFQKLLQILLWAFFDKTHGFYFNQKNVVKNKKLWFPAKPGQTMQDTKKC